MSERDRLQAIFRMDMLERTVRWQRRERERLEGALIEHGVQVPAPDGDPELVAFEHAICRSPYATKIDQSVEDWMHDHEARAVRAVQDFEREWLITDLQARLEMAEAALKAKPR
jgi:hypothetical protein